MSGLFFFEAVRIEGVLMGLTGKFVRGEVFALVMSGGGGGMCVRGKVVQLGGWIVRALRHDVLLFRWRDSVERGTKNRGVCKLRQ